MQHSLSELTKIRHLCIQFSVNNQPEATNQPQQKSPLAEASEQVAQTNNLSLWFSRFANKTARLVGHPVTFLVSILIVVVWGVTGPVFHYSDTWQLIINTGTSVLTFLVVFLIQNTQNRDAKAIHLKLDELIRSHSPAHNDMIDIENLSDEELGELENRYAAICREHEARQKKNISTPKLL
jgi:low affinity Fe/Cu permease